MAYRVRRRRAKVERYRLLDYLGVDEMSLEAYRALRRELIAVYSNRLELMPWFWTHEPGVPDALRDEPDYPDPRLLTADAPSLPDAARFEADCEAYGAVMARRRKWLASHHLPVAEG